MALGGISGLDYTVLLCADLAAMRCFYRDIMGFAVETDRETWVDFRLGTARLSLRPRGAWPLCDDGVAVSDAVQVQLAFKVALDQVQACHAALLEKGVAILRGPTDLPQWRHRTLFFRDPEGNILEIYAEY